MRSTVQAHPLADRVSPPPGACCVVDRARGRILWATRTFAAWVGLDVAALVGRTLWDTGLASPAVAESLSPAHVPTPALRLRSARGGDVPVRVDLLASDGPDEGCVLLTVIAHAPTPLAVGQLSPLPLADDDEARIREALVEGASAATIAAIAADQLRAALGCPRVCVVSFDFVQQSSRVLAVSTDRPTRVRTGSSGPLDALPPDVAQPRLVGAGLRASDAIIQRLREEGFDSFLCTPLIVGDRLAGAVNAAADEGWIWYDAHQHRMRRLAECLAVGLSMTVLRDEARLARDEFESLSGRLLLVQDAERQQIGRELHDDLGQLLVGLMLSLPDADEVAPAAAPRLRRVRDIAADAIERVRTLSFDIRTPVTEGVGLPALLSDYIDDYTRRTGVRVSLISNLGDDDQPGPAITLCVYRVVQESLTNVARHARVDAAEITLSRTPTRLMAAVIDRGCGFDPHRRPHTLGLLGMTERARILGGTCDVIPLPGRGTTVLLSLPIEPS